MDARVDLEWARPWLIVRDHGREPGRVSEGQWVVLNFSSNGASKEALGPKVGDKFEPVGVVSRGCPSRAGGKVPRLHAHPLLLDSPFG